MDTGLNSVSDKIWINLMKAGSLSGCHQVAERSYFIRKYQFPVCARCSGVFVGEMISLTKIIFMGAPVLHLSLIGLGIMFIDWFLQRIEVLSSTNTRRLITGILGGYGLIGVYYCIFILIKNIISG